MANVYIYVKWNGDWMCLCVSMQASTCIYGWLDSKIQKLRFLFGLLVTLHAQKYTEFQVGI